MNDRFLPVPPPPGQPFPDPIHGAPPPGYAPALARSELHEWISMIRRHRWLVLLGAVLGLGVSAYRVTREVPEYRAGAVVRLADIRGQMAGGIADAAVEQGMIGKSADPLLSQIQVLRSRAIAEEVVEREGLRLRSATRDFGRAQLRGVVVAADAPIDTFLVRFTPDGYAVSGAAGDGRAAYGQPVGLGGVRFTVAAAPDMEEAVLVVHPLEAAAQDLQRDLIARPRERTDVIDVEFVHPDPYLARSVVNASVLAFQDYNARGAQQQSRRRREFVEEQLRQTTAQLADAQVALSAFRKREQVYSSSQKLSAQQSEMVQVEIRRSELAAEQRMYQSLLRTLQERDVERRGDLDALVSSPGIAANPVISGLYAQLTDYQTARDTMTAGGRRFAETHPDVQRLDGLIASTSTRLLGAIRGHVATLDARIAALSDLRGQAASAMTSMPDSEAEEMRLAEQAETYREAAKNLRDEYQKARIAEAVEAGQVEVVDLATLPTEPLGAGRTRKLVFGLLIGLMLGGGAAYLRERLDTAIQRREEMEEILGVPALAVIPRVALGSEPRRIEVTSPRTLVARIGQLSGVGHHNGNGNGNGNGSRAALATPEVELAQSIGAEAYRSLRTNLLFSRASTALRTVAVTSAAAGEGKTTTSANLAAAFAQQGMRVLLVDCDLRRPRVAKFFKVNREPGLTELLSQQATLLEATRATPIEGLYILPAGTIPPNPAELLGSAKMRSLLDVLANSYDMVVIDSPPILAAAETAILGTMVDGIMMVVRAGSTGRSAAQLAMRQLNAVGARVLGAVLNDPDGKVPQYAGYHYYYYSYYGSEKETQHS